LDGWFTTFWIFTICHYLFGIGRVLASTIAAPVAKEGSDLSRVAGIIAAICIAIIGFLKPDGGHGIGQKKKLSTNRKEIQGR